MKLRLTVKTYILSKLHFYIRYIFLIGYNSAYNNSDQAVHFYIRSKILLSKLNYEIFIFLLHIGTHSDIVLKSNKFTFSENDFKWIDLKQCGCDANEL